MHIKSAITGTEFLEEKSARTNGVTTKYFVYTEDFVSMAANLPIERALLKASVSIK